MLMFMTIFKKHVHPFPLKEKQYFRKVDFPLSGNFPNEGVVSKESAISLTE